jgi:RNA polymerase sigma-70 factor (ECF subfamily)
MFYSCYDSLFSLEYDESRNSGNQEIAILENSQALEKFLSDMERRAFRRAQIATGNRDEALDIVQDAMFALVSKYANKSPADWKLLFHRILTRRIIDWHRQSKLRAGFASWFAHDNADAEQADYEDETGLSPEQSWSLGESLQALDVLLRDLPLRQQQVFLLRAWEGLSEKETARAMSCTVGTVKTHYSRARTYLRQRLQET